MEKDKDLKALFDCFEPELTDERVFMEKLTCKLDAIECVKQERASHRRTYRYMMSIVFVVGVMTGAVFYALMEFTPNYTPLFTYDTDYTFMSYISPYSREIVMIFLSFFASLAITLISYTIYDTYMMKKRDVGYAR